MESSEKIIKELGRLIGLKQKILIIGRGPTARFANDFTTNDTLKIGFHNDFLNPDIIITNEIVSVLNRLLPNYSRIKVGSVFFDLATLLNFFESFKLKLDIDLIGFDFNSNSEDDDLFKKNYELSKIQRKIDIESQLVAYNNLLQEFQYISIKRIGFDRFSNVNPKNKNFIYKKNKNVEIVAEITTNHFGDTERLMKLIEGAHNAGADSIKLQKREVETFYSKGELIKPYKSPFGKTFYDYRKKLELTDEQINLVIDFCRNLGIKVFFSVLDLPSYRYIKDKGFDRIKLPSTISNKIDFIKKVSKNFKGEIVVSTGMTNTEYESFILETFQKASKLYLLQCISSYPAFYADSNLKVIKHYEKLSESYSNIVPGYSSHDVGALGSCLAVACGAKMIEKHIKIGVNPWAHFDDTALDVEIGFKEFCAEIRSTEMYLGTGKKSILDSEHHKY